MFLRFARVVLVGFCVTMVAQQTSAGSILFGDECSQDCPDDVAPHRCPLNCTACACCGHGIPVSSTPPAPFPVQLAEARIERDEPKAPPDPRPDTIFHVPRSLLG